jgi:hypothetical protein
MCELKNGQNVGPSGGGLKPYVVCAGKAIHIPAVCLYRNEFRHDPPEKNQTLCVA